MAPGGGEDWARDRKMASARSWRRSGAVDAHRGGTRRRQVLAHRCGGDDGQRALAATATKNLEESGEGDVPMSLQTRVAVSASRLEVSRTTWRSNWAHSLGGVDEPRRR